MERILPFCALRYNDQLKEKIHELVAPPYDVVSPQERDFLVYKNQLNIFSIELPKPSNNSNPFEFAKEIFDSWIKKRILICDESPCIYPYYIDFTVENEKKTRKGFICLVKLEDWNSNVVKPHERTFNKVTTDRLNLLKKVRANLSPIFMLHKSTENISQLIDASINSPIYTVKDRNNNTHYLYKISNPEIIKIIQQKLSSATFYIADGHHRYTTSLEFSKSSNDPKAKYIMTYLVDSNDNGLVILPTHRIIKLNNYDIQIPDELNDLIILKKIILNTPFNKTNIDELIKKINSDFKRYIVLIDYKRNLAYIFFIKNEYLTSIHSDKDQTLYKLDVYLLEEIILKKIFNISIETLKEEGRIRYLAGYEIDHNSIDNDEIIFYLNPTTVKDVIEISDKNLIMPQKSTYFYPKILTGFVINSFDHSVKI